MDDKNFVNFFDISITDSNFSKLEKSYIECSEHGVNAVSIPPILIGNIFAISRKIYTNSKSTKPKIKTYIDKNSELSTLDRSQNMLSAADAGADILEIYFPGFYKMKGRTRETEKDLKETSLLLDHLGVQGNFIFPFSVLKERRLRNKYSKILKNNGNITICNDPRENEDVFEQLSMLKYINKESNYNFPIVVKDFDLTTDEIIKIFKANVSIIELPDTVDKNILYEMEKTQND